MLSCAYVHAFVGVSSVRWANTLIRTLFYRIFFLIKPRLSVVTICSYSRCLPCLPYDVVRMALVSSFHCCLCVLNLCWFLFQKYRILSLINKGAGFDPLRPLGRISGHILLCFPPNAMERKNTFIYKDLNVIFCYWTCIVKKKSCLAYIWIRATSCVHWCTVSTSWTHVCNLISGQTRVHTLH